MASKNKNTPVGPLTDEALYIERQADGELLRYIHSMEYVMIIEPRQQGKTSMIRHLMRSGCETELCFIYVDLSTLDIRSESGWYQTLCKRIRKDLKAMSLETPLDIPQDNVAWRDFLSEIAACARQAGRKIVIVLDEIGGAKFDNNSLFFTTLREVYTTRQVQMDSEFQNLTFILVGAFNPQDLIQDPTISPFNIAQRVHIEDFTMEQVQELMIKRGWEKEPAQILAERVHYWTNGQPYLTQLLCANLKESATLGDVDNVKEKLYRDGTIDLRHVIKKIKGNSDLKGKIRTICSGGNIRYSPNTDPWLNELYLLGLIRNNQQGYCAVRNLIYEQAIKDLLEDSDIVLPPNRKSGIIVEQSKSSANQANPYKCEVFVSYAWGGTSEKTVDTLEQAFTKWGIHLTRDKRDLEYRGSITEFEKRIGHGQCVVLVISDRYLRSTHCMNELLKVVRKKKLRQRVFPIVLQDAHIYQAQDRVKYIKYWDEKIDKLNRALKSVEINIKVDSIQAELVLFTSIRASIDRLTKILSDMNALTPAMHKQSGYALLIRAIERALAE